MPRSLFTARRGLVLVTLLLVLASLLPGRYVSWFARPGQSLVAALLMPLEVPLRHVATAMRPPKQIVLEVQDPYHAGHDRVYIDQLEQEIERLRRENRTLQQVRDVLGEERAVRAVAARVGAYSGDRVNPTLRIDRGSQHGVAPRQSVVTGFALVGEVERVGPVTADVRLFTSVESRLRVRIVPPQRGEPPRRYAAWMQIRDHGGRFVIEAERDDPIEVGDWAHLADERWPREAQGFVVARVVDVRRDPDNPYLSKLATLQPVVELSSLRQVTVLAPER